METLTHPLILFWLCMLLHLIADYTLQGCLANLKQKSWWNTQLKNWAYSTDVIKTPEEQRRIFRKYKYDYIAGIGCHALMWSIMTYLPLLLVCTPLVFSIVVVANTVVHAIVDHAKANLYRINLCEDQLLHVWQIVMTLLIVI